MDKELLSVALCLGTHPILKENATHKVKYVNVLEYFVRKYSRSDIFSIELLNVYKEKLLEGIDYHYNVTDIKRAAKGATGYKFRGFKLFSYRNNLLFDCLFINAFHNNDNAKKILDEVKSIFSTRYHKKITMLYEEFFNSKTTVNFEMLNEQIHCWKENKKFSELSLRKILITANMSAGKSTLINALVGKKVNKTQNDACTAKAHYIFNKPYEDEYAAEWDYQLVLNADLRTLMEDNPDNKGNQISVGTFFRSSASSKERICIIDTPGVNSSLDEQHKALSYGVIEDNCYDILVCVLNASNIGTFDDQKHLQYLAKTVKDKKLVFVINQLDKFDKEEDSIDQCILNVKQDIEKYGFSNVIICPVSAYAALLAKKQLYNEQLTEVEKIELQMYILKFKESSASMQKYFIYNDIEKDRQDNPSLNENCIELLNNSGIVNLEKVLFE